VLLWFGKYQIGTKSIALLLDAIPQSVHAAVTPEVGRVVIEQTPLFALRIAFLLAPTGNVRHGARRQPCFSPPQQY